MGAAGRAALARGRARQLHGAHGDLSRRDRLGDSGHRRRIRSGTPYRGERTMSIGGTHEESYERGLAIRKEVLGEAHVQRSLDAVSEFSRPIQELVTEYCWGEVWS